MEKFFTAGVGRALGIIGAMVLGTVGVVACSSPPNENPAPCNDKTPQDTAFATYLDAGEIPTTGEEPFRFEVTDNHYDACDHISWLGLTGTTQPEGEQEDSSGFVVFFQDGDLVTDPRPVQMGAAPFVDRNDADDQVIVQFGHYAPPGQATTEELRVETFNYVDDRIEVEDEAAYEEYAQGRNQLVMQAGEVCSVDPGEADGEEDGSEADPGSGAAAC